MRRYCLLLFVVLLHSFSEASASNITTTPSSAAGGDKALLVVAKNSGAGFGIATFFFLAIGVFANVDVTPLIWHAQWLTFAPFLEGYAGNNTLIWADVAPPKGNNPNGMVFRYEEWGSNYWPLALNISWVDFQETLAIDFNSCAPADDSSTTTNTSGTRLRQLNNQETNQQTNAESSDTGSFKTSLSRFSLPHHRYRRLANVETCSFKDKRNIKRVTTFINVCFSYLIYGAIAVAMQLLCHFGFQKKWNVYLGGTHWIKTMEDLQKVKPWTFAYIPFKGPKIIMIFIFHVAFQPMVFGCMLAISTGNGKFSAIAVCMFILCIVVPLLYQSTWVSKHVVGQNASLTNPEVHTSTYVKAWQGWRDIEDRNNQLSWRKSIATAGNGVLFHDYYPKWKGWLTYWLILQTLMCLVMSPLMPIPAKIQAVIIMAVYFMYFVTVGLMMPFRKMAKYFIHLLMCMHNGIATAFTQFTDPEGLFNMQVSEDIASKGVDGADQSDGILIVLGGFGLIVLYVYISVTVIFKVIKVFSKEELGHVIEENHAEFRGRSSAQGTKPVSKFQSINAHTRQQSDMLKAMFGDDDDDDTKEEKTSVALAAAAKEENSTGKFTVSNPMKKPSELELTPHPTESVAVTAPVVLTPVASTPVASTPTAQTALEPLPEHWSEHKDPTSGKTYFMDTKNKSTTWTRPKSVDMSSNAPLKKSFKNAAALVIAALPEHWSEHKDPNSGKTYYMDTKNNVTSWTRPTAETTNAASAALPTNWHTVEDPTSGKTYYHNRVTSKVSWTVPKEAD